MPFHPSIFHMYDIRGLYPRELDRDGVYVISRGFVQLLKKEAGKEHLTICIGRDARPSSDEFFQAFARGIQDEGGRAVDIGLAMTPAFYFAVAHYGYDGGVNITASHNPNPYNGLKLVRAGAGPLGGESGLQEIREIAEHFGEISCPAGLSGDVERKDIIADYIDEAFRLAGNPSPEILSGLSCAIDTGNGVAGIFVEALLARLSSRSSQGAKDGLPDFRVHKLYFEVDGNFPYHIPDPLIKENITELIAQVKNEHLSCGIAFDGDGDRIIFVDEKGTPLRGDIIMVLMARMLLEEHKGAKILYDVRATRAVEDAIRAQGGMPVPWRIGHTLIKEKMRKDDILFGGELSGHYFMGSPLFYEVPFFVMLSVLRMIKESGEALSALLAPLTAHWHHSGEINFTIEEKVTVIDRLAAQFSDGEVSRLDGLRVDYPDWWFNVRPSNTEPLLRLVVEADSEEKLQEKVSTLKKFIEE